MESSKGELKEDELNWEEIFSHLRSFSDEILIQTANKVALWIEGNGIYLK
jgi:hypothetical protein